MRSGENNRNILELEKKAGQKAARTLRRDLRSIISQNTTKQTGTMLRLAGAKPEIKFDSLNAIVVKASYVTFIQHYGFEGVKSNGVKMRLKNLDIFDKLFNKTNALTKLADELSDLGAEEITSKIKF